MTEQEGQTFRLELHINGETRSAVARAADLLLDVLRDSFGLTGAKPGCLNGDCGTCTVLLDGWPMKSCLSLAIETVGKQVMTIEGLSDTPIQREFVKNFAFQCGYCTPGFLMNLQALSAIAPEADEDMMTDWLQSNICRCTGYAEIRQAACAVLHKRGPDESP
jgi:carbon-monoxide dehydrogenase small subunit